MSFHGPPGRARLKTRAFCAISYRLRGFSVPAVAGMRIGRRPCRVLFLRGRYIAPLGTILAPRDWCHTNPTPHTAFDVHALGHKAVREIVGLHFARVGVSQENLFEKSDMI